MQHDCSTISVSPLLFHYSWLFHYDFLTIIVPKSLFYDDYSAITVPP